jgi:hypothetical protein
MGQSGRSHPSRFPQNACRAKPEKGNEEKISPF